MSMRVCATHLIALQASRPHFLARTRRGGTYTSTAVLVASGQLLRAILFGPQDARFSNDTQEQRFGANIMGHLLNGTDVSPDLLDLDEDYIVCFCGADDKLSQWRGYAPQGGVSIGFDFHSPVPFYALGKDEIANGGSTPKVYQAKYVQLGKVCYLRPRKDEEEDKYYKECAQLIGCPEGLEGITDIASKRKCRELIKKNAPYIKHAGFSEEDESRLVFRNEGGGFSKCIRYKDVGKDGSRQPYIIVCAGNPEYARQKCTVRLCVQPGQTQALLDALREKLGGTEVDDCRRSTGHQNGKTDSFCFGCTRRRWKGPCVKEVCRYQEITSGAQWGLPADENSIIISQGVDQKEVFEVAHEVVQSLELQIPVWCEGHLPIRSITVSPCIHQKEVEESIRHYCRHIYWLRDVKIQSSSIPFRQPG